MPTASTAAATRIFCTRLVSNACDRALSQPRVAGIEAAQGGREPGVRCGTGMTSRPGGRVATSCLGTQKRALPLTFLLE
jgi:hypothetical protein